MNIHISTKERLIFILNDLEIIAKELIDNTISPKQLKMSPSDHSAMVDLLVAKDEEFKSILKIAAEQENIEEKMTGLRKKVDVLDKDINILQKQLKEAEHLLSTALFQARQKLASIQRASKRSISSEELIKYAHRISSSNAICAPLTWSQGDLRRPYPTDIEMRVGFLGKSDLNINGHTINHQNNGSEIHRASGGEVPAASQSQFAWNLGEIHMSMGTGSSVSLDTRAHKDAPQDDVEVMSTDSSSSSSSDSQ